MALILLSRFLSSDSLRNEGFFIPPYAISGLFRHPLNEALEQITLLLEEIQPESFSPKSLEMVGLTKREAEVLFWVAKDYSTEEIAKQLGMGDRTVKKHLEHIYEKLGVQTRTGAVMYALEKIGIIGF